MQPKETGEARWNRYRAAIAGAPLPLAIVDLDALEGNVARVVASVAGRKPIRVASKSIRSPALLRAIALRAAGAVRGVMTYTAGETAFLFEQGFDDLLLAYPTVQSTDTALLAGAAARGATLAVVVDSVAHLEALDAAARVAGTTLAIVVEMDLSYRPLGSMHIGVRRSPLWSVADVVAFAQRIGAFERLRFRGVMGYEAQIAGAPDKAYSLLDAPTRAMKALSRGEVLRRRSEVVRELSSAGLPPALFNGGGTGSLASSAGEDALTEVTAGSGFLDNHLCDHFHALSLEPAAYFALQVVREPAKGIVTCHGGGYVASGEAGAHRSPLPALPEGLALLALEGAGEVQTPLTVPRGVTLRAGDPVFFRHAKAGELAEHFNEYLLVRGDRIESRAPTYRGMGHAFLG